MTDLQTIRANVGSMLDQGAPAEEVERYLASEGVTAQDLKGRMSPQDERAYAALAADPRSTAADLQAFARQRGFDVTDEDAASFITGRSQAGGVGSEVVYRDPPAPVANDRLTGSNTFRQDLRGLAGSFADGLLPGIADDVRGVRGVIDNAIGSAFGGEPFDPAGAFQDAKEEQATAQGRFAADNPGLASVADWTGTATGLFALPQAKLVKGATLARGVLNSAANGLGYGALGGALNDTGGGRLENAGWGALAGAGIGAAAPVALAGLSSTTGMIRRNVPGVERALSEAGNMARRTVGLPPVPPWVGARAQAERVINRQLEGATIATGMGTGTVPATPSNIAAEVARRKAMGVPAIPADVTEPARRITSRALRGEGQMASRARAVIEARQAQQGSRVRQHLADELGPVVDPVAEAGAIAVRAKSASGAAYRAAYAQPVVVTPEMAEIMQTPAFQEALPQAVRNIRNAGRSPMDLGFQLDEAGNIAGLETLSTEGFDQVVRAMRDSSRAAAQVHPLTGQPIHNTNSVHIDARARSLRDELAVQNPAYADAVGNYADEMALRDALERGGKVSSLTGPEIAAQLRSMPQHAQEAWTAGARSALADDAVAAGLQPGTNVAQRTRQALGLSGAGLSSAVGDTAKQQAIEAASGRPGVMGRLDDRLEAEDQAFQTFGNVAKAAPQLPRDDQGPQGAVAALGTVGKAATGNLRGAAADLLLRGGPQGTAGFRRAFDDHAGALLTVTDPSDVADAMAALERRSARDQAQREALHGSAGRLGRLGTLEATAQPTGRLEDEEEDLWSYNPALFPAYQSGALSHLNDR